MSHLLESNATINEARAWLRKTVAEARYSQHRMLQERRKIQPNHAQYYQQALDRYLYAAHVVWHILTDEWKGGVSWTN